MTVIAGLLIVNSVFMYEVCRDRSEYTKIVTRAEHVRSLLPMIKELDAAMWGIVSVYNPVEERKVTVDEREQYKILNKMNDELAYALELANDHTAVEIDIIQRLMNSLTKKMDKLKAEIALQKLDTESTAHFFKDSIKTSSLKDSYVDEMQAMMERIRLILRNLERQIGAYMEAEMQEVIQHDNAGAQHIKRWLVINISGMSVLLLIAFFWGVMPFDRS
jgi:hypothetical protein